MTSVNVLLDVAKVTIEYSGCTAREAILAVAEVYKKELIEESSVLRNHDEHAEWLQSLGTAESNVVHEVQRNRSM